MKVAILFILAIIIGSGYVQDLGQHDSLALSLVSVGATIVCVSLVMMANKTENK